MKVPGQSGPIGAGALDTDPVNPAVAAEPGEQLGMPGGSGGELLTALEDTEQIDDDSVMSGRVSVDAADDGAGGRAMRMPLFLMIEPTVVDRPVVSGMQAPMRSHRSGGSGWVGSC